MAEIFLDYFFSHKNAFSHYVLGKREEIQTIFEIVPTKNLIRFLCYILIDFDKSLVTLTHIKFS